MVVFGIFFIVDTLADLLKLSISRANTSLNNFPLDENPKPETEITPGASGSEGNDH